MNRLHPPALRTQSGIALMEILVISAIVIALAAVTVPIYGLMQSRSNRAEVGVRMRALGTAAGNYRVSHDNQFPGEDAPGSESWAAAANPKNKDVWFNALPELMGKKRVADYAATPAAFYTKDNPIYVPGAPYPTSDSRLVRPLFAISFNSKLEKKTEAGGKLVRMSDVANPARTVLFLEEGLPKEERTVATQPHYNGAPKGSARSFVGRYSGKGWLTFCDGHAELVDPSETLDVTGQIVEPETNYIWNLQHEATAAGNGG